MHLYSKWTEECREVDSIRNMIPMDHLSKLLPKQTAVHIKNRKPTTVLKAEVLVDEFYQVRRWHYSVNTPKISMKNPRLNSTEVSQSFNQTHNLEHKQNEKTKTSNPNTQQSSSTQNGSIQTSGHMKKKVDAKFSGPDKEAQCFLCWEWRHKAKDCEKKVCNIQVDLEDQNFEQKTWSIVQGIVGCNQCRILLDLGAQTSMVKSYLVPGSSFLGCNDKAKEVEGNMRDYPMARVRVR